jgi:hypothetical protein
MPGTLTPTCSFCGLRFASRPLLELHIREDHLQRDHHLEPDRGDAAGSPRTTKEVITMTATPRRHRLRAGWAMTAARAVIRMIRHLNAELLLASEAMCRPVGAAQPRPRAEIPADAPEHAGSATERARRAA